uniref:Uncharacterized protein n=1 Tax=Populus alba TaxID=43335 RepID=A0A4V6A3U2_POPAL|nr:hypothetical protein D5086_0000262080 [Populus alba]
MTSRGGASQNRRFVCFSCWCFPFGYNPIDATLDATGGAEDKGFLWKIGDGDWKVELNGHEDSVSCLAFSADGQLLASGGVGATVRIWDSSGHHRHKLEDASSSSEVEWHPRRPFALAGSTDCIASMWDAEKGVLLNAFYGHGGSVTCGDFTPDDHIICTGSTDATLRIWDAIRSEAIHVVRVDFAFDSISASHFLFHCQARNSPLRFPITENRGYTTCLLN